MLEDIFYRGLHMDRAQNASHNETSSLETYFTRFREATVGSDLSVYLPDTGKKQPMVYADWIASGRLYRPIEKYMQEIVGPLIGNTHTETTFTGTAMTMAYHEARDVIRRHVNAGEEDLLFLVGNGMTGAVNKMQRMLGLRIPEALGSEGRKEKKPVVLITHMEHHSNQITWEECDVDLIIVPFVQETGLPDLEELEKMAKRYAAERPMVIGSFTAGSNVTGILTPIHEMAAIIHRYGGICFADYAAAAPYVEIDMHPREEGTHFDGIMFSPHKFLGGPGTSGVLLLSRRLYHNTIPDNPGGGTVRWTSPFGHHLYIEDIETREDGGTPGFLQAIRTALTLKVKEEMGSENIRKREEHLMDIILDRFAAVPEIAVLEGHNRNRLGIISFFTLGVHHNLIVRLLNDRYGIQTRGGCSCAGTYGHILFHINKNSSNRIEEMITKGDLSEKPGWVRISVHPTMTDAEAEFIASAVIEIIQNSEEWGKSYQFDKQSGDFIRTSGASPAVPALIETFVP